MLINYHRTTSFMRVLDSPGPATQRTRYVDRRQAGARAEHNVEVGAQRRSRSVGVERANSFPVTTTALYKEYKALQSICSFVHAQSSTTLAQRPRVRVRPGAVCHYNQASLLAASSRSRVQAMSSRLRLAVKTRVTLLPIV
jgi:hypothetical protein